MANKKANTVKRFVESISKEVADAAYNGGGGGSSDGYIDFKTFMDNVNGKKLSGEKFVALLKKYNLFSSLDSECSIQFRTIGVFESDVPYCEAFDFINAATDSGGTFKVQLGADLDNHTNGLDTPLAEADVINAINNNLDPIDVITYRAADYSVPMKSKPYILAGNGENLIILDAEEAFDLFEDTEAPTEPNVTTQQEI